MKTGFTFGKYYPFHEGHKSLIDFGLGLCDRFIIIICASYTENIPVSVRSQWIKQTYASYEKRPEIIEFEYDEEVLTNTSVSSKSVSEEWSGVFIKLLSKVDFVITSETYGDYVANFMNIEHIPFDQQRIGKPISATDIRKSPYQYWKFLPVSVKPYYQKKVVFLGSESTGKSSVSKALLKYFKATLVAEIGRDIVKNSNFITKEDLLTIASQHAKNIASSQNENAPLILIDTDIHITQSYAMYEYGEYLQIDQHIYESNVADLYIYLGKDLPYEQDGTRLSEKDRNTLDKSHKASLGHFGINYIEVNGTWEQRFLKSLELIKGLVNLSQ